MKNIHKITTMIAMFAAVTSLSVGFIPQAVAQSTLTVDLQPVCGFSTADISVSIGAVTPPANAVFTVDLINAGSASLPVSANLGDATNPGSPVGGFSDGANAALTDVHILPADVTVDADDGIESNGAIAMINDGSDVQVATLGPTGAAGEGSPRTATITAATNNLQNTPAVGVQTAVLTFTGGTCA